MVQKKVVVYTCDNCPAEGTPEGTDGKDWKKPLPLGWVDMNVVSNDGVLMSHHLCPDCFSVALKAMIRRHNRFAKK